MVYFDVIEFWKGVVCCSVGNYVQGVVYLVCRLKILVIIVMFKGILSIKYFNVLRMGGYVVFYGVDFDEVKEECVWWEKQDGLINIFLFDDFYVIVG